MGHSTLGYGVLMIYSHYISLLQEDSNDKYRVEYFSDKWNNNDIFYGTTRNEVSDFGHIHFNKVMVF
jgi:hypothetical protein